jgi:hypothetical protein
MTSGGIARQCHRQLPDISEASLDREEIDKGLSRVLTDSVSTIDHGKMRETRHLFDGRDVLGPGDDKIAVLRYGPEVILEIFTLGLAKPISRRSRDVDDMMAESGGRDVEAYPSPRTFLLEKKADHFGACPCGQLSVGDCCSLAQDVDQVGFVNVVGGQKIFNA